ncbi:MAG: hypothetical protein GX964_10730 [Syntrophomonadaceae bacterium]|jgi:hypothetical protein|nr:hypothetical protein [Syntrophomonadaceae bacterium]
MGKGRRRLELTLPGDHVIFQAPKGTWSQTAIHLIDTGSKFEIILNELALINARLDKIEGRLDGVEPQINMDAKELKDSLSVFG